MRGEFRSTAVAIAASCTMACGLVLSPQLSLAQQVDDDVAELARAAQNPIASMISVPFQNNTNFDFGPLEKTQNVLNIQPVIPFELNDD